MTYFDPDKHPEMEPPRPRRDEPSEDDADLDISKKDWIAGDRVLAPWGQAWLYPGTVGQVGEAEVFVYFDDGDRGWTQKGQVRPLQILTVGSPIHCRWKGGTEYYPGRITQMNGESIFVQYDDGDSEWSVVAMIAVPSGLAPTAWEVIVGLSRYAWILLVLAFCLYRACR